MTSKSYGFKAICLTAVASSILLTSFTNSQEKSKNDDSQLGDRDLEFPTAQEVIDKYVRALGGYELLGSRERLHYIANGFGNDGSTFTFEAYHAEGKYKSQYIMGNGRVIERGLRSEIKFAEDGSRTGDAWEITNGIFREMAGEEKQDYLRRSASISSITRMFSHYKSIEFDGSEEIDGRPNYKLLLTNRDGKEVENYFDAETGLLRRIICNEISSGRKVRIVRDFLSYEQFGEFVAWKKLVMTQSDGKTWTFEVEEYESDGRIPKGIFDLPPAMKTLIAQSKAQKNSDLAKLKTD